MHNNILMFPHIALAKVKHDESLCPHGEVHIMNDLCCRGIGQWCGCTSAAIAINWSDGSTLAMSPHHAPY